MKIYQFIKSLQIEKILLFNLNKINKIRNIKKIKKNWNLFKNTQFMIKVNLDVF